MAATRPDAAAAAPLHAFSALGIELEYMLVDHVSLDVRPVADRALQALAGSAAFVNDVERGALGWSNELVLHVLELKNRAPSADLPTLADGFLAEVGAAQDDFAALGVRLMPGGMHPWMDPRAEAHLWPHVGSAVYQAYDRTFDCRRHGWANVQAMHLNLPFAGDAEFERLHAAVRALLPLVPAVAASSPFAEGRATGLLDTRLEACRVNADAVPELAGLVVPENYASRAQYQSALLAPLYAAIAPHDPERALRHEWLNARGAIARFDRCAIEIRVADVQEHPAADVALAALLADVAWWLYEEVAAPLSAQLALDTRQLAATLQAVLRDAERAVIDYAPWLRLFGVRADRCTAAALWAAIAEALVRAGAPHTALWRRRLEQMLAHGTLARRLLAAAGPEPGRAALGVVYRELCDCLDDGRDFLP